MSNSLLLPKKKLGTAADKQIAQTSSQMSADERSTIHQGLEL